MEKPIFFEEETKKPNEKQISKLKSPFRTDLNRNHPRGDKFFNKVLSFFKSLLEESPNEEELKKPIEEQHFAYKVKKTLLEWGFEIFSTSQNAVLRGVFSFSGSSVISI